MTSAKLLYALAVTISFLNTEAQSIPGFIQNLPLKPNQSVESWGHYSGRYDIITYLDDHVMNDNTIDSLANDSRILMDSIIAKFDSKFDYLGFKYVNRASFGESNIWLRYWLRSGKITQVDSLGGIHFKGDVEFPLLSNQYFLSEYKGGGGTYIHDLILCNIISKRKKLDDSLNHDSKKLLVKLLKAHLRTDVDYTSIRIRYVSQIGADIMKEYKYPLTHPYSATYYMNMYKKEK